MSPVAALLLSGIFSTSTGAARSPAGIFRHLSIEDGLSDSHLRSIAQDEDGYLWSGAVGGLNRYFTECVPGRGAS